MSQTVTLEEGRAYVFVAVEHANSEIIGIHAARSANRFEALEPVRQGVYRCFGSIAPGVARGLKLRHDHGSNYMSGDFQSEIKCLGIEASPSFVREPEGNGVAERFIRTLKENLLWVRTFKTIEELRAELVAFARRYNETWLVARLGSKRPRGSERSKPCHQLRLTRRSLPPYPWPPEQASRSQTVPTTKSRGAQSRSRRMARSAARIRNDPAPAEAVRNTRQSRSPTSPRQRRGRQLSKSARARPHLVPQTCRLRLDRRAPQFARDGGRWLGQKLARLRARS